MPHYQISIQLLLNEKQKLYSKVIMLLEKYFQKHLKH